MITNEVFDGWPEECGLCCLLIWWLSLNWCRLWRRVLMMRAEPWTWSYDTGPWIMIIDNCSKQARHHTLGCHDACLSELSISQQISKCVEIPMDALNTLDKELFLASYDYLEFTHCVLVNALTAYCIWSKVLSIIWGECDYRVYYNRPESVSWAK